MASGSMTGVFADNGDDQQVVCTGSVSIWQMYALISIRITWKQQH